MHNLLKELIFMTLIFLAKFCPSNSQGELFSDPVSENLDLESESATLLPETVAAEPDLSIYFTTNFILIYRPL